MAIIDPVAVIKKIYLGGKGGVPYPTFMLCFNKLLASGPAVQPKMPSPELKEAFEACCMAMNCSVEDTQDRQIAREREFYDIVWPVWEQNSGDSELGRYQKLIDGFVRRQVQAEQAAYNDEREALRQVGMAEELAEEQREEAMMRAEKQKLFAQAEAFVKAQGKPQAEDEPKRAREVIVDTEAPAVADPLADFDDVLANADAQEEAEAPARDPLDERTQLMPGRPITAENAVDQAAIETQIGAKRPTAPSYHDDIIELDRASMEDIKVVPDTKMCNNVADLIRIVTSGELPVYFSSQKDKKPYAFYRYQGEIVELKLIEANGAYYLLLGYPRGHGDDPVIEKRLKEVMDELNYQQTGPFAYEKVRGKNKHKVRIGSKSTNVGHKRARVFSKESLIGSLNDLNMILTSILDRVHQVAKAGNAEAGS